MLRDAERRQADALETARRIGEEAEARAQRLGASLAQDAEDAEHRRERVVADRIAAAGATAVKDVREAATVLAVEAATRVLRERYDAAPDRDAIDGAVA